jgi:hypothetical protein
MSDDMVHSGDGEEMQCEVRLTILGVRQHVDESYAMYASGRLDGFE